MPLSYTIEPDIHRIVVVADGQVELADGRELIERIPADESYDSSYDILIDFTRAVCNPSPAEIRRLLRWLPALKTPNTNKVAILTSNSFHYGMARMASILAGSKGISLYAFVHENQAYAWLDSTSPGPPETDELSA